MDFSKLNNEFNNMQKTVFKYNEIILKINNKIKENLKIISKYETKIKNNKDSFEKEVFHLYISSLKNENKFLESIINNEEVIVDEKKVLWRIW